MDVAAAIRNRRAVRDYEPKDLERSLIAEVVDEAIWAPSGMNRQPWSFLVIEGRDVLAACSAEAKAFMLSQAADHPELAAVKGLLEQADFNIFYNAPALILICATASDEMAVKDCCLAAQTLMLAAHDRGLGTCWIGFSEGWLNTPQAKRRLGIPEAVRPVAPIIIGHPKAGPGHAPERRPAELRYLEATAGG